MYVMTDFATLYIVRGPGFGQDFTPKLIASAIAIALVIWDCRQQRRSDYAWVFFISTIVWAFTELFLSIQGIRDMPTRMLMGRPISLALSVLIQGMSEGAFVAVTGLFIGDRILKPSTRIGGFQFGGAVLLAIIASVARSRQFLASQYAASRRDLLDLRTLSAFVLLSLIIIVFLLMHRAWRQRVGMMFLCMTCLATVWTIAEVTISDRWVEIEAGQSYAHASVSITAAVLTFDAVFEIAWIYASFLAIPVALGLLRNPDPLPRIKPSRLP